MLVNLVYERRKAVRLGHHVSSIFEICGDKRWFGTAIQEHLHARRKELTTTGNCGRCGGYRLCMNACRFRWRPSELPREKELRHLGVPLSSKMLVNHASSLSPTPNRSFGRHAQGIAQKKSQCHPNLRSPRNLAVDRAMRRSRRGRKGIDPPWAAPDQFK